MIAASRRGVLQEPRLPTLFFMFDQAPDRVQVRGVGRQPDDGQPVLVWLGQGAHHGADVSVKSARRAVPAFRPARFSGPLPAPGVPLSRHWALRKPREGGDGPRLVLGQGAGMREPRQRQRVMRTVVGLNSSRFSLAGHQAPPQ
jgi:hypothetical protein